MTDNMEFPIRASGGRWLVKCLKCGHEWLANTPEPKRCPLCKNPNPDQPRKYNKQ